MYHRFGGSNPSAGGPFRPAGSLRSPVASYGADGEFPNDRAELSVASRELVMRIRASWLAICVCGVAGYTRPADAQVDQQRAQTFFREAQALCERDGGRLWGVSVCSGRPLSHAPMPKWCGGSSGICVARRNRITPRAMHGL